jgi:hypothetical protein
MRGSPLSEPAFAWQSLRLIFHSCQDLAYDGPLRRRMLTTKLANSQLHKSSCKGTLIFRSRVPASQLTSQETATMTKQHLCAPKSFAASEGEPPAAPSRAMPVDATDRSTRGRVPATLPFTGANIQHWLACTQSAEISSKNLPTKDGSSRPFSLIRDPAGSPLQTVYSLTSIGPLVTLSGRLFP